MTYAQHGGEKGKTARRWQRCIPIGTPKNHIESWGVARSHQSHLPTSHASQCQPRLGPALHVANVVGLLPWENAAGTSSMAMFVCLINIQPSNHEARVTSLPPYFTCAWKQMPHMPYSYEHHAQLVRAITLKIPAELQRIRLRRRGNRAGSHGQSGLQSDDLRMPGCQNQRCLSLSL